ncbi:MAG: hypothetical protein LBT05_10515 [Planctomycetaceae bacterium]|jgi:hypothetical protein|nr:hypothetical protein [Planctomycetaceae bacterium]
MTDLFMGFEGKFYVGPSGKESPTASGMILADSVRNPQYTWQYTDVDATLRRHNGIKAYIKGMLDVSITFTLPNEKLASGSRSADAQLILDALRNRHTPITIIMLDVTGGEGLIGDFELFSGDKSEEDENLQEWTIEAKPSAAGRAVSWYETPSPPQE